MNRRQKLVQQQFLNNEQAVIKRLEYTYDKALGQINEKIRNLEFKIGDLTEEYDWMDPDDPARAKVKSMIQSKIYQKKYQEALQGQIEGILNQMQTKQFLTVSDYLGGCYEDGFVGSLFDLHGQGIPLTVPINQEAMVRAVQLESKISQGLYNRLGEDVGVLKKKITAQVSRAIVTGASYAQTAKQLAGESRIGYNNAVRITRTEGHRIQTTAAMDAMELAKERGADVLKQWDATLDGRTRESHAMVDGEIREMKESFSNGLMYPGDPSGGAAEVVNCRCAILQRARWALDDSELETLKKRAEYYGLDKATEFDDFKKKYLKAVAEPAAPAVDLTAIRSELKSMNADIKTLNNDLNYARRSRTWHRGDMTALNAKIDDLQKKLDDLKDQVFAKGKQLVENLNTTFRVTTDNKNFISMIVDLDSRTEYNEVRELASGRTLERIVSALGGGDKTSGSCASVGLGYIGQKNGWDVLDFRGGDSMDWFSSKANKVNMWNYLGVTSIVEDSAKSNLTNGKRILAKVKPGKEYYLSVGRHAAIVRKNDAGVLQYLELQSATNNGWQDFQKDIGETLRYRFGCSSSGKVYSTAYLTDIESVKDSAEFRTILGYINTNESMQRKGASGTIK